MLQNPKASCTRRQQCAFRFGSTAVYGAGVAVGGSELEGPQLAAPRLLQCSGLMTLE